MQTQIVPELLATPEGREADAILRTCVHCGFCTATCPTYQLLGDELDGPRGRIYQIKQVLEGHRPTRITQGHLDRCLTCRSCETTCPSGVRYGRLADIGRHLVDLQVPRPLSERWLRAALVALVPHPRRFAALIGLGRLVRPLLPVRLAAKVPTPRTPGPGPRPRAANGSSPSPAVSSPSPPRAPMPPPPAFWIGSAWIWSPCRRPGAAGPSPTTWARKRTGWMPCAATSTPGGPRSRPAAPPS